MKNCGADTLKRVVPQLIPFLGQATHAGHFATHPRSVLIRPHTAFLGTVGAPCCALGIHA
jgi:hypothetical protein